MRLKLVLAALCASASFTAFAADQTFAIAPGVAFKFDGLGPLLSGHGNNDTNTYKGAPAGLYEAILSYSCVNVKIASASLNGERRYC